MTLHITDPSNAISTHGPPALNRAPGPLMTWRSGCASMAAERWAVLANADCLRSRVRVGCCWSTMEVHEWLAVWILLRIASRKPLTIDADAQTTHAKWPTCCEPGINEGSIGNKMLRLLKTTKMKPPDPTKVRHHRQGGFEAMSSREPFGSSRL